jgi:hypothetical protein
LQFSEIPKFFARMQANASCIASGAHGVLPIEGWPLARGSEGRSLCSGPLSPRL